MDWKKIGIFAAGTAFGYGGIKLLSSRDAKKAYTCGTAAVLRVKDAVLDQVTALQENCSDIYAEAKVINEERAESEEIIEGNYEEETEAEMPEEASKEKASPADSASE